MTTKVTDLPIISTQVRDCPPDYHTLAVGLLELVKESMRDPVFMAKYEEYLKEEEKKKGSRSNTADD